MIGRDDARHCPAEQVSQAGFPSVLEVMNYLVSRRYEKNPGTTMVNH